MVRGERYGLGVELEGGVCDAQREPHDMVLSTSGGVVCPDAWSHAAWGGDPIVGFKTIQELAQTAQLEPYAQ